MLVYTNKLYVFDLRLIIYILGTYVNLITYIISYLIDSIYTNNGESYE